MMIVRSAPPEASNRCVGLKATLKTAPRWPNRAGPTRRCVEAFHSTPDADVLAATLDGPAFSVDDTRPLLRDHTYADWRDVLPRTTVPVTAMAGRHSPVWPWQSSAWMAEAAPAGKLVVFEHSGHVPMLEEADTFNRALLEAAA